jgi:hypothetical protein
MPSPPAEANLRPIVDDRDEGRKRICRTASVALR